jgi:hypothetical protein
MVSITSLGLPQAGGASLGPAASSANPSSKTPPAAQAPVAQPALGADSAPETTDRVSLRAGGSSQGLAVTGAQAYERVSNLGASNPYARTISGFIGQQLARDQADGASQEALYERLAAGYAGFNEGFNAALEELAARGLLTDELRTALNDTREQVSLAVDQMAKTYGIDSPVAADSAQAEAQPPESQALPTSSEPALASPRQQASLSSQVALLGARTNSSDALGTLRKNLLDTLAPLPSVDGREATKPIGQTLAIGQRRDFSLELETRDGDRVRIQANSQTALALQRDASGVAGRQTASQGFSLTVEGDIDESELRAINELVNGVADLADTFFNGDLASAFEQAQQLGFDSSEISQYALSLQRVDVQKVQNTYAAVSEPTSALPAATQRWQALGQFLQQMDWVKTQAQAEGYSLQWLQSLTEQYSQATYPDSSSKLPAWQPAA